MARAIPVKFSSALIFGAAVGLLAPHATLGQTGSSGTLDPTFGVGGRRTLDFHNGQDQIEAIVPLRDGRAIAAGFIHGLNDGVPGFSRNFAVVRFLADGRLDPEFAQDGIFQIDIEGTADQASAALSQPDGKIVVVGAFTRNAYADMSIVRLLRDGTLDPTFGDLATGGMRTGATTLDVGGEGIHDEALSVALQSDGRYVVAGTTRVPFGGFLYRRIVVARFMPDGTLDTSYGTGGHTVLQPFFADDADDIQVSIALTPSERLPAGDRITLVGHTFSRNNAFLARLTTAGLPDTTFGETLNGTRTGRVHLTATSSGGVFGGVSAIHAARILGDGRIVVAGTGNDRGMTFMRFGPDGALDTTFGTAGRTTVKLSDGSQFDEPFAMDIQGNGRIVGAGYVTVSGSVNNFFVARLLPGGQIDNGFGDGQGRAMIEMSTRTDQARTVAIEPSGRILVGGFAFIGDGSSPSDFALARLLGDRDRIFFHDFEVPPGG
jgi:uncharacterized delta-60 repeat protein